MCVVQASRSAHTPRSPTTPPRRFVYLALTQPSPPPLLLLLLLLPRCSFLLFVSSDGAELTLQDLVLEEEKAGGRRGSGLATMLRRASGIAASTLGFDGGGLDDADGSDEGRASSPRSASAAEARARALTFDVNESSAEDSIGSVDYFFVIGTDRIFCGALVDVEGQRELRRRFDRFRGLLFRHRRVAVDVDVDGDGGERRGQGRRRRLSRRG